MTSSRVLPFCFTLVCGAVTGACSSDGNNKPDGGGGGIGGAGGSSDAGLERPITGTGGSGGAGGSSGGTGGNPLAFCNGVMPAPSPTTIPGNSLVADFSSDVVWGVWDPASSPSTADGTPTSR